MMTGRLHIDGLDAYTAYGIYVTEGGWTSLAAMPAMKPVQENDWQEQDGVQADLSAPKLAGRRVRMSFAGAVAGNRWRGLAAALSDGAYHTFQCDEIARTYHLRLLSSPDMVVADSFGLFTLELADDFPLEGYEYLAPESSIPRNESYTMDGRPFSDYGATVLEGLHAELTRMPTTKGNMRRDISILPGIQYDAQAVTFAAKDIRIRLLLRANTLQQLWRNYDALLYDLTRPQERSLYSSVLQQAFPFYYRSCTAPLFCPDGRIWLELELSVRLTRNFRLAGDERLLAAEDGKLIITEDGAYTIDLAIS